ncbi:uncharacterized protein LOC113166720 isoform X2 [Anabas testudineus]|uniref:uncharacterized protein LOC113166720 isoform X2 n=1 Tax=Anabas testudineus TaxID=64144 RepID=UPI000E4586E9|nr:uncharacterized protein LOC113166720 isoform X2 [Anabas testudineus]XP_026222623.1 uncharacterized protein LOC113166720 isoform X2 [Anabas testudineus]
MARDFLGSSLCNLLGAGCTLLVLAASPVTMITMGALYIYECPAAPVIPLYVIVFGISVLLVIGLIVLPKSLCPGAQCSIMLSLSILSLILFVFIWIIYGSYHIYSIHPPNYNKNLSDTNRVNNSIYSPPAPDTTSVLTLDDQNQNQNQNQSLLNFNHTRMISNNQTLMKMIQTLAQSKSNWQISESNGEHLNTSRFTDVVPYCDRTVYLFAFWITTLVYGFIGTCLVIGICLCVCMKFFLSLVEHIYG